MTIDLIEKYPGAGMFKFGDSAEMCTRLNSLVRKGKKTATCGALRDFEAGGEDMPVVGRCDIATNWDDSPALVIRTTHVERMAFDAIGEDFALAEGENEDYKGWRNDHIEFFKRNGGFTGKMEIVCERFELVEDLAEWEKAE